MGIEPTSDALTPLNGFEDRGGHQTSKLFPAVIKHNSIWVIQNGFQFCNDRVYRTGTRELSLPDCSAASIEPCPK